MWKTWKGKKNFTLILRFVKLMLIYNESIPPTGFLNVIQSETSM